MTVVARAPGVAERVASPLAGYAAFTPRLEPDPFEPSLWQEAERLGGSTPYQRAAWIRAYAEAFSETEGFRPAVVTLRDAAGRIGALLPLAVGGRHGIRVAAIPGGKHANYHLPLASEAAAAALATGLGAVGRLLGVDALAFTNMPRIWDGRPNPLGAMGRPSPSNGHKLSLQPDGEATLRAVLSSDKRKKLRQKERYLAQIAPVRYLVAATEPEVDAVLDAFLRQKAKRFAELGIADPFASEASRAFLRRACLVGLEAGRPAVELHALLAGERVAAVFGAAADERHCSGMFVSFDPEPAMARCSPGDLLLTRVIQECCRRGRTSFDLGVGEARYKDSFCPEVVELVDVTAPITARGHAYFALLTGAGSLKRRIKASPRAWAAVSALRRCRARFGRRGGGGAPPQPVP